MNTPFDKLLYTDIKDGNIVSTEEKRLTLAYEGLTDIPKNLILDYGQIVEILDLSHNKLKSADFLKSFENLKILILDHNHLTSETVFPQNDNLTTLWLNHNFIDKLTPFVQNVGKAYQNLKFLSLMGNAAAPSYLNGGTYYEYIQYRLFVISWLPQLEYLDDRVVTDDQRNEANRLFGRSFYKTLVEQQIPEFLERIRTRLNGFGLAKNAETVERSEGPIPGSSNGGQINNFTSIPVDSQPVRLNSSDSDSSLSSVKRKQRNLVI